MESFEPFQSNWEFCLVMKIKQYIQNSGYLCFSEKQLVVRQEREKLIEISCHIVFGQKSSQVEVRD